MIIPTSGLALLSVTQVTPVPPSRALHQLFPLSCPFSFGAGCFLPVTSNKIRNRRNSSIARAPPPAHPFSVRFNPLPESARSLLIPTRRRYVLQGSPTGPLTGCRCVSLPPQWECGPLSSPLPQVRSRILERFLCNGEEKKTSIHHEKKMERNGWANDSN